MKVFLSFLVVFWFLMLSRQSLKAQLSMNAQIRIRSEVRDGYRRISPADASPAFQISQRTRLKLHFKSENLQFIVSPQDVRIWGDENIASSTGVFGSRSSIDLFEGYAQIGVTDNLWLSAGRQPLVYDNQRLLASRNWNQLGMSYDALLIKFNKENWKLHLAGSWNTLESRLTGYLYPSNRIKSLNFIWFKKTFSNTLSGSVMHVVSGMTETDTTNTLYFRQTTGTYTRYKNEKLDVWGNVYYQYGNNRYGQSISAYLFDLDGSLKLGNLQPGLGISYLSGNPKQRSAQQADNLFNILYGARHKFFGNMDYFRNFMVHTKEGGLINYYFRLTYAPAPSVQFINVFHYHQLAESNNLTPTDKKLGYENNLIMKFKFSSWGVLQSGYAFMLPAEPLKEMQNISEGKFPQFFYLQLHVKPSLL